MKRKQISIRMPEQMIEDLKLLAGSGSYQALAIMLLDQAVNKEISKSVKRIQFENEIMRQKLKDLSSEIKEIKP